MQKKLTTQNQTKFQFYNVIVISFGHFCHDVYSSFLAPILPLLIEKFSLSYSLAGLLYVIQRIPTLINPFFGLVVDKTSTKFFVILAPATTGVIMSFLTLAPSYAFLCLFLFSMGVSTIFIHVPGPALIRSIAGNKVGAGMSFFMLGGELARGVGPIVILGAITLWGMDGTYRLIPFGCLASIFLFIKLRKIKLPTPTDKEKSLKGLIQTWTALKPILPVLTGITFCKALIIAALATFLPTYMTLKGASLWSAGASLSIFEFAGAAGTISSGTISDKIGRKKMLLIIAITSTVFLWLFIFSSGLAIVPALIILGFAGFSGNPVLMALVQDSTQDYPASANGIYLTMNFIITPIEQKNLSV